MQRQVELTFAVLVFFVIRSLSGLQNQKSFPQMIYYCPFTLEFSIVHTLCYPYYLTRWRPLLEHASKAAVSRISKVLIIIFGMCEDSTTESFERDILWIADSDKSLVLPFQSLRSSEPSSDCVRVQLWSTPSHLRWYH